MLGYSCYILKMKGGADNLGRQFLTKYAMIAKHYVEVLSGGPAAAGEYG